MKVLFNAAVVLSLRLAMSLTALAQWGDYPTPGVPKLPDGKPNLTGPVPRTADGKPDLSGIWQNNRGAAGQRGTPGGAAAPATPPPPPPPAAPASGPPLATFGNVGAGFPEGLPILPWAADLVKKRQADNSKDNPDAHCLPMGFMQFHTHSQPRK